jgi:hypothetical protein
MTHTSKKAIVPAIPFEYHVLPHFLDMGTAQNTCAAPPIAKSIVAFGLKFNMFGARIRCRIPAIAVAPAAA